MNNLTRCIDATSSVYAACPQYAGRLAALRRTTLADAQALLGCYSDDAAARFFNSDNCNGDDFRYKTIERMRQAIEFWDSSYENRCFVRWSVLLRENNAILGTVEMFRRSADDRFDGCGLLRIDLRSDCERRDIIADILGIAEREFYNAFGVDAILTKAIPAAAERRAALARCGYEPLDERFMVYDDYFIRRKPEQA